MAYDDKTKTNVRETVRTTESSGSNMALIVGGLVVAVGFILWLVFGNSDPVATTDPAANTTNVTIEPSAAPADTTTVDPAPDAVEPEATAPADGAEPAPAAPATPPASP
jgi:hypothetical protein